MGKNLDVDKLKIGCLDYCPMFIIYVYYIRPQITCQKDEYVEQSVKQIYII